MYTDAQNLWETCEWFANVPQSTMGIFEALRQENAEIILQE